MFLKYKKWEIKKWYKDDNEKYNSPSAKFQYIPNKLFIGCTALFAMLNLADSRWYKVSKLKQIVSRTAICSVYLLLAF